ncbi:MAG: CRISPR-associated endonuclease Cas2 [Nitrospiraceae bacterium]|nr:CRISPR-associated endonuclease Cas2 [Nitrospiraceae bacterium]MDA8327233.1 CRISPR-associated endonuclease Cas2 [Nitrospiraceae bacterium]
MRRCYLVCYDIRHPKRLRRVFKIMKGYGEHWQFSVFFCILKDIDRVRLQSELEEEMNLKEDQVMIIDMGSNEDEARKATAVLGQSLEMQDERIIVI